MRRRIIASILLGLLLVAALLLLMLPAVVRLAAYSQNQLRQGASRPEIVRQLAELSQQTHELRHSESQDIADAAKLVERWYGINTPQRAMTPNPNARQPFDPNTASLYDIVRAPQADGSYQYEFIYVDAAGQTLRDTRPHAQMSDQDLAAAQIFEMARQNPNLRILVETVRRMAEDDMPAPTIDVPSHPTTPRKR